MSSLQAYRISEVILNAMIHTSDTAGSILYNVQSHLDI